jgi:ribose transport system permease protein
LNSNFISGLFRRREAGIFIALACLIGAIAFYEHQFLQQHQFLTRYNIYLVSRQIALVAIVALAVFFVILTGGIDLSVGSTVGLSGFICGLAMAANIPPLAAVGFGLLTGAAVGAVNGAIVAYLGVTPFIVTLGMLGMARGVVMIIKRGDSVRGIPRGFIDILNGDFAGVSVAVWLLVVLAILSHVVLRHTAFGRRVYAIGGNEEATALSGINTRQVKFLTYVICGAVAAITGLLYVARFGTAQADAGRGLELDAIAATVIGGTSLMGGEGSVPGVLIGAAIMGVIRSGLVMMRVSSFWQDLIIGAIIILAAILDVLRTRKHRRT